MTPLLIPLLTLALAARKPAPVPATQPQPKLPVIEIPATRGTSDTLVVFVSGDGGWAAIDKAVSKVLAGNGLPVVGLNALQYFWTKRTPESASRDLQALLDTYLARWHKSRVLLVGYSRGADVLPAMVNRMRPELQQKVRLLALLGPSPRVEYEFHMRDWLHDSSTGIAVRPELEKLAPMNVLCLWGEDDRDSLCKGLSGPGIRVITMKGAHHFDGGYEKLAQLILGELH